MLSMNTHERRASMEEDLRKEAIRRHLLDGESPKAVYTSINRSKEWFFKWLKRFQTGAEDWFKDHSKAPKSKPIAISSQEKEIIIATRTRLESDPRSQFGVSAIKWELHKLGLPLRSDSTINRTLKREGLVKKNQFILPRELNTRTLPRLFAATTYTRWTWSAPAI
jgi:transposase